ncbi:hypothetical protein C8J56DRAFT_899869 [Mycena floridula]|nr:hypothetical protein C8J56DRAFT_899869 [Mycena floridula]
MCCCLWFLARCFYHHHGLHGILEALQSRLIPSILKAASAVAFHQTMAQDSVIILKIFTVNTIHLPVVHKIAKWIAHAKRTGLVSMLISNVPVAIARKNLELALEACLPYLYALEDRDIQDLWGSPNFSAVSEHSFAITLKLISAQQSLDQRLRNRLLSHPDALPKHTRMSAGIEDSMVKKFAEADGRTGVTLGVFCSNI